jgi:hypothetical protein
MAQTATLHVKIEPRTARGLKRLARSRGQTVGEMVRQAISSCYQPDLAGLGNRQRQAVEAYRGGFISLGRLAEALGLSLASTQTWLVVQGLAKPAAFARSDAAHA